MKTNQREGGLILLPHTTGEIKILLAIIIMAMTLTRSNTIQSPACSLSASDIIHVSQPWIDAHHGNNNLEGVHFIDIQGPPGE